MAKANIENTTPSRRAILAGAATLPALAVPAAFAASPADPIFGAVEHHKAAHRRWSECARVEADTPEKAAAHAAVKAAYDAAYETLSDAAFELTEIQPTTMAGVLALLQYVEAFNEGAFYLETESGGKEWRSVPSSWPEFLDEEYIDIFGYELLSNVRRALTVIAVQS